MSKYTIIVPKANCSYTIDESKMPVVSCEHAHEYGWRQSLVDSTASIQRKNFNSDAEYNAAAKKLSDARYAAYLSGAVRRGAAVDPFQLMATTLGISVDELKKKLGQGEPSTSPVDKFLAESTLIPASKKGKAA